MKHRARSQKLSESDPIPSAAEAGPNKAIKKVEEELYRARDREKKRAAWFGGAAFIAAIAGIAFLTITAARSFDKISIAAQADPPISDTAIVSEATYLLVRGMGLSAIVGGIVYFLFNLARSALDQATRYEKRWIASHLIDYALHSPDVSNKRLDSAHRIVEVWGSTIESAYTPPRVAKSVASMKLSAGKDGGSLETSDPSPP